MVANHATRGANARTGFDGPPDRTEDSQTDRTGETTALVAANVGAATTGTHPTRTSRLQAPIVEVS